MSELLLPRQFGFAYRVMYPTHLFKLPTFVVNQDLWYGRVGTLEEGYRSVE